MEQGNGWDRYQLMVLNRLDCLDRKMTKQGEEIGHLREAVAQLRVKAGLWGALSGAVVTAVPVMVGLLFYLLRN